MKLPTTSITLPLLLGFFGAHRQGCDAFTPLFVTMTAGRTAMRDRTAPQARSTMAPDTEAAAEINTQIDKCKRILIKASETKKEDPEIVLTALRDFEKSMRQKAKHCHSDCNEKGVMLGEVMKNDLNGEWRLIFTTGTASAQEKYGGKINYFPFNARIGFRTQETTTSPMVITNGFFLGDFPLVKISGEMDFDVAKRKLDFGYNEMLLLGGLKLNFGKSEAIITQLAAMTGLGGGVSNAKSVPRQAYYNWISADDDIATARGSGGGLSLWRRVSS